MKTKFLKIFSVCAASALLITGCGIGGKDDDSEAKLNGKYAPLYGLSHKFIGTRDIDDVLEENEDDLRQLSNDLLKFDDGEFIFTNYSVFPKPPVYYGEYNVDDNKIEFEYEECKVFDENDDLLSAISIDGDVEGESSELRTKAFIQIMENLNETGNIVYCLYAPPFFFNDKIYVTSILPCFVRPHGTAIPKEGIPLKTNADGSLLLTDTYGFELDGKYKHGKDFTIEFNPIDAYTKYKYSPARGGLESLNEDYMDIVRQKHYTDFEVIDTGDDSDFDTTIEFSDGEWEWYNKDGELLNDGYYQESSRFKGLVHMTLGDAPKNQNPMYDSAELIFYISDDGDIYYPSFFRID